MTSHARWTVGEWMTRDPVTIEEDASVLEAMHLVEERHVPGLPVMRAGRLVGLVSEAALPGGRSPLCTSLDQWELRYLLARAPVREVMDPAPHALAPETGLAEAARLLRERRLPGAPVVDSRGDLVGVFTTADALAALAELAAADDRNPQVPPAPGA